MITVADILALPAFEQVQPLVLCEEPSREKSQRGHPRCAPDKDGGYESYIPGEFIVTNLGFAHDDPELSERSLLVLIARGVSGIALKKAYRPIVSDRVRAASEAAGVPMYLYDGGYHEVVAYQALDLIRRDSEQSDKGRIMDGLLSGHDPHAARAALYELAGATGSTVQCSGVPESGRRRFIRHARRDDVVLPSSSAIGTMWWRRCSPSATMALLALVSARSLLPACELARAD
ncbi:MAG: hypothetical protein ACLTMP_04555 [Eggerthella lenta]